MAIQEESDEGEDEKPKDDTFNVTKGGETEKPTEEPKKSMLIEEVKSTTESTPSQEDKTWWKKGTETLNYDDFKKTETKPQPKEQQQQKPPQKMTRVQIEESEDEEEPAKTVASTITLDEVKVAEKFMEAEAKVRADSAQLDKKISQIERETKE